MLHFPVGLLIPFYKVKQKCEKLEMMIRTWMLLMMKKPQYCTDNQIPKNETTKLN